MIGERGALLLSELFFFCGVTARDLTQVMLDMGTSQQRMARHDQWRLVFVRLEVARSAHRHCSIPPHPRRALG